MQKQFGDRWPGCLLHTCKIKHNHKKDNISMKHIKNNLIKHSSSQSVYYEMLHSTVIVIFVKEVLKIL